MSATVPNRNRPSGEAFDGLADAPITTRSWCADSRMMAVRTEVASRSRPFARRPPCSLTNRSSACCSCSQARSPSPLGTTCSTTTWAPNRLPRSRASRIASSACGPPRTGTRIDSTWSRPRCLTTAMSQGDSRTTASMVEEKTGAGSRRSRRRSCGLGCAGRLARGRRAAPAEDDQVGALLADRLDHTVGRATADADHGPDLDPLLVPEVQDALQEAPGGARLGGALRERDALRHLDDPERGDLGRPPTGQAGADAHQVARRARVGKRQQDPVRLAARGHQRPPLPSRISRQRATRYGLSSSNSFAWPSTTRSAWSVVISSVSPMKLAVRAK